MTSAAIWARAKEHISAILLLGVLIYLAYWVVGMAPWPKRRWSKMAVEWASVEAEALRRFSFSALAIISLASLFLELMLVRGIPTVVWLLSVGLVVICWLTSRRFHTSRRGIRWHFFFLGAAFLLLEVQIISKTALLFGTTWLVNSIVITALLMFILLSNVVISWAPQFPRQWACVGLMGALAAAYLTPADALFFDSMLARGAVAGLVYCSPVFFAGLIFITSFREGGFCAEAFGSNLVGSLVGGLLESLSFLIGIAALVIVAALLYLASALSHRRAALTKLAAAGVGTPVPSSYSA
jgi:hypothetical protein